MEPRRPQGGALARGDEGAGRGSRAVRPSLAPRTCFFWRAMTGLRLFSALSRMDCGDWPIVTWGFTAEASAASKAGRVWLIKRVADPSSLAKKRAMGCRPSQAPCSRGAMRDPTLGSGRAPRFPCARSRRLPVARALTAGLFAFTAKEAGISLPSCLPWWAARSAITERNEIIMVLRGAAFEKCLTGGVSPSRACPDDRSAGPRR